MEKSGVTKKTPFTYVFSIEVEDIVLSIPKVQGTIPAINLLYPERTYGVILEIAKEMEKWCLAPRACIMPNHVAVLFKLESLDLVSASRFTGGLLTAGSPGFHLQLVTIGEQDFDPTGLSHFIQSLERIREFLVRVCRITGEGKIGVGWEAKLQSYETDYRQFVSSSLE